MRLFITIVLMVLFVSACTDATNDVEEASSSDTQASPEDTVLLSEDVEVSEVETGDVTPAGDTTPEADVPEEE